MLLDLANQMQWPFAMVCIAFCASCGVVYIVRRVVNANEVVEEKNRLASEVYRLTRITKSEVHPSEE